MLRSLFLSTTRTAGRRQPPPPCSSFPRSRLHVRLSPPLVCRHASVDGAAPDTDGHIHGHGARVAHPLNHIEYPASPHPAARGNRTSLPCPQRPRLRCLSTSHGWRRPSSPSAFVSRHNQSINVSSGDILDYCARHQGSSLVEGARTTSTHVVLRECPFCTKPTRNDPTNLYKLHIQIGGGAFFCHRCGTGGSWYDLKARFGGFHVERGMGGGTSNTNGSKSNSTHHHRSTGGGFGGNGGWNDGYNPNQYNNNNNSRQGNHHNHGNGNGGGTNQTEPCLPMPPSRLSGLYSSRLLDDMKTGCSVDSDNDSDARTSGEGDERTGQKDGNNDALRYLTEVRGLTPKTLRKYGVGRAAYRFPSEGGGYKEAECVTFPWIMRESDVRTQEALRGGSFGAEPEAGGASGGADGTDPSEETGGRETPTGPFVTRRIKARALERKSWQRLDPPGGGWGLFGLHTVPNDCKEIVLTEGEYDAMAVHQATGLAAVSLPNGCRSLPVQVLPLLERFDKIVLWMDDDAPGREGAEKFAKKLGIDRTHIVAGRGDAKDANDALLRGDIDLEERIEQAALVPHDRIVTFGDLRNDVLKELLEPELYSGTPITSLPKFTQLIKGFRRGEMTVLTGPTGCGKTTFLGQVSLDLAEQGENVLWGSFEIKNTRLLHKLLKQFSRDSLPINTDKNARENFEALADRFETLPLYFMKFHGGSDVDEVLDAMEYAVYVNDVEHIILDNMQFMITRHSQKSSWDKFEVQDVAIEKFRKFATEHNVHVTLVVHPRKEDESSKLSISSFFGSAKATQEADTVIIIQNDANRRKYLDVKKNRFDGTLGYTPIYFQNKSGRYVEDEGSAGNRPAQKQQPQGDMSMHLGPHNNYGSSDRA